MSENITGRQKRPKRAVRLIFEYEDDNVVLISQQDVDIAASRLDARQEAPPGNYVEVRTEDGGALSRVPIGDVFSTSVEVFPEYAGDAIVRVNAEKSRGAFSVVVPAVEEATQVAVLKIQATRGAEPKTDAQRSAPEELGVFPLTRAS